MVSRFFHRQNKKPPHGSLMPIGDTPVHLDNSTGVMVMSTYPIFLSVNCRRTTDEVKRVEGK